MWWWLVMPALGGEPEALDELVELVPALAEEDPRLAAAVVRYAERHGIARTIRNARELAALLDAWEQNPRELDGLKKNMRKRHPHNHPRDILERAMDCRIAHVHQDLSGRELRQDVR